jgi:serine protease
VRVETAHGFDRRSCVAATAVAALLAMLVSFALPVGAEAKRRPGAPRAKAVERAIGALVKSTPFPSGRAAAKQALAAFQRKKSCRASDALATHQKRVAGQAKLASRKGNRGLAKRYAALERRSVETRALLLRSLPRGKACGGPAAVAVDRSLKPEAKLPKIRGFGRRPLARMEDAYGHAVDFVANELIVKAPSLAKLQPFLKRWGGKVLATVDLAPIGGKGKQFLVRIDVDRAETGRLAADIAKLSDTRGSVTAVSSEQGLELLAAAAGESRKGTQVGVNYVAPGTAVASGSSIEAATGPNDFATTGSGYDPNAFNWKHFSAASTQGVGTAEAWRLIERSGRSANKVGLAVLDMGFAPITNGPDFGEPLTAISNVPFTSALGTSNLIGCGGGSSCPWHGTNVANTAFAVPDNGLGVAGTGGPVARRIVIFTLYDFFTGIGAVVEAGVARAQVLNMSYGADVPAAFSWTVLPFEATTGLAHAAGMVLAAAAGNSNTDVDEEDCFIVCWEETLWTPCENVGVFCVGALGHDSTGRASYSNWGRRGGGVDIFAPGTVLVGGDPAKSGVHSVNGTSFASPYLAGVAALVKAVDPSLSGADIQRILIDTAKASPDGRVRRYVDALAAVKRALPRLIRIESPANGSSHRRGTTVGLSAFVYDDDLGAPTSVTWTLPNGVVLGTGAAPSTNALPYGTTTVKATAVFPDGASVSDSIEVTATNDAPSVELLQPDSGETFEQGELVQVSGLGRDINQFESGFQLTDVQLSWFLDGSVTPFDTGREGTLNLTGVAPGVHTITLRGTDDLGATAQQSTTINVEPESANNPPVVDITSPINNASKPAEAQDPLHSNQWYATFNFQASVSDADPGDTLTYKWTDTALPSGPTETRSTAQDPGNQRVYTTTGCSQSHDWKLEVSDGTTTRSDTVRVTVEIPC